MSWPNNSAPSFSNNNSPFLPAFFMKKILLLAALCFVFSCDNSHPAGKGAPGAESQTQVQDSVLPNSLPLIEDPLPVSPAPQVVDTLPFTYDLEHPDGKFKLPGRLDEISGLGISEDGTMLVAVNDEQGKLFFLDKNTGKVVDEFKFGKSGDYEGVEIADGRVYVVNSSGTLYTVSHPGEKKQETTTYKTVLHRANDVEGLAYDKAAGRLFIACKGRAGEDDSMKGKRAIYSFDLEEKKLGEEPLYLISRDEIGKWRHRKNNLAQRVIGYFDDSFSDDAFGPSGLAIHPLTGEVYVLSSVGKCLVVLSPAGKILHFKSLNPDLHQQPEGICFDSEGTLYISNEAKGGTAKLFKYRMK
jgi:uncharacterized protein YjiK